MKIEDLDHLVAKKMKERKESQPKHYKTWI